MKKSPQSPTRRGAAKAPPTALASARRRLPLRAVEVFEAVVRLESAAAAARELHITPSAVSQQLKNFEERLGAGLFVRAPGALRVTPAARALLPAVTRALDLIEEACRNASARDDSARLTLSVLPSVASRWLVPRLADFRCEHPDITVLILSEPTLIDFGASGVDAALRYGVGGWPGVVAEKFFAESSAPLAAPSYLARHPINGLADLPNHALIDEINCELPGYHLNEWCAWLARAGISAPPRNIVATLRDSHNALQMAVAGEGVVLGRSFLAADEARAGRLANPLNLAVPTELGYYLVYPSRNAGSRSERFPVGYAGKSTAIAVPLPNFSRAPNGAVHRAHKRLSNANAVSLKKINRALMMPG